MRTRKKITQAEIPNYIDITRGTWSNYELNKAEPNIDQLIRISQFFGVTVHELLCEDLEATGKVEGKLKIENPWPNFSGLNEKSSQAEIIDAINKNCYDIEWLMDFIDKTFK